MSIKEFAKDILKKLGYKVSKYTETDIDSDKDFTEIYNKCKDYTMVSRERCYGLYNAVKYVIKNNIPGDFVECGVWRGGSAMIMALTIIKFNGEFRTIWLYDTYEGMSEPTKEDVSADNKVDALKEWNKKDKENLDFLCYASLEEVKNNMLITNYPEEKLQFIKGKVEDTIPKNISNNISILRLDTDWYESTKHELIYLYPRLEKGGVLVLDDYGFWSGSRKAVDDYCDQENAKILLNKMHNGRIGVKV